MKELEKFKNPVRRHALFNTSRAQQKCYWEVILQALAPCFMCTKLRSFNQYLSIVQSWKMHLKLAENLTSKT